MTCLGLGFEIVLYSQDVRDGKQQLWLKIAVCMLKCLWERYWTLNCYRWHHCVNVGMHCKARWMVGKVERHTIRWFCPTFTFIQCCCYHHSKSVDWPSSQSWPSSHWPPFNTVTFSLETTSLLPMMQLYYKRRRMWKSTHWDFLMDQNVQMFNDHISKNGTCE